MDRFVDPAELVELLGDWSSRDGPLYRRLADALRQVIADGAVGRDDRLPAERVLAGALSVSRATVVGAYDALRDTGEVATRRGSGTRVGGPVGRPRPDGRVKGGRATSVFQRLVDRPDDTISLALAVEPAIPQLREALADLVERDLGHLLTDVGYHPGGLPALRAAVAEHHTALGVPTGPEQVLVTTGAHQALGLVGEVYLARGATVLVESPSWPGCLDVFRARGATAVGVPIDDEGIRPDRLADALAAHRPDLVYVMPTFNNPTGTLTSRGRRARLAELAARHGVPVLEDNAYSTGPAAHPPVAAFATGGAEILSVGSLAKSVWAGLRIGWVRADRQVIDRLARRKALADLGSPVLDQALAARLLPRLAELTAAREAAVADRLAHLETLLRDRLPSWDWRRPDGGSALWIRLPDTDAAVFAQVALRHGVEIVPGSAMDPGGRHDDHIRLPFTFPVEVLDTLVGRLERAWRELTRDGTGDPRPVV
ncbi:MAG TPA: PLP-dependent aminotransferase family protein [Actinophytocola sp.]|nr:PLP-dependent aminotransferase family protein [Actinophytocola sp.]